MKCRKTSADFIGKGRLIMSVSEKELKVGKVTSEITSGVYTCSRGITVSRGIGTLTSAMFFGNDMSHVYEISPVQFDILQELFKRHSTDGMFKYAFSIID